MDGTCLTIIGAMATAVVGLAGYVVKLHKDVNEIQKERVKWMEDQVALVRTIHDELDKSKGGRR